MSREFNAQVVERHMSRSGYTVLPDRNGLCRARRGRESTRDVPDPLSGQMVPSPGAGDVSASDRDGTQGIPIILGGSASLTVAAGERHHAGAALREPQGAARPPHSRAGRKARVPARPFEGLRARPVPPSRAGREAPGIWRGLNGVMPRPRRGLPRAGGLEDESKTRGCSSVIPERRGRVTSRRTDKSLAGRRRPLPLG